MNLCPAVLLVLMLSNENTASFQQCCADERVTGCHFKCTEDIDMQTSHHGCSLVCFARPLSVWLPIIWGSTRETGSLVAETHLAGVFPLVLCFLFSQTILHHTQTVQSKIRVSYIVHQEMLVHNNTFSKS